MHVPLRIDSGSNPWGKSVLSRLMHFLAAAAAGKSSAERLRDIPPEFWIKIGIGILVIIAAVVALRKLAKMNKVILSIVVLLVVSIVGFNWIYERNEPEWATPAVNWLANYFPTKDAIQAGPGSGVR
jgi:hypothetical protein